ncbi:MAG: hypothetical protein IKX47_01205 [Oscillospiraceae bacterium]|nr:hypothetical protein [Oscillospiraceae bacterium]
MKKTLCFILSLYLLLSLAACGRDPASAPAQTSAPVLETKPLAEQAEELLAEELRYTLKWPVRSYNWRLTERDPEDPEAQEAFLVDTLLGEGAEYDPETGTYRAGVRTLDLTEGAKLTCDTLLARALVLTLPLRKPETLDPRDIPALEDTGWLSTQRWPIQTGELPFIDLYFQTQKEITLTDETGEEQTWVLNNQGGDAHTNYVPDLEALNARLKAVLREERARLGNLAFLREYRDLMGFSFTKFDLKDLYLICMPIQAILHGDPGIYTYTYVSPWGELASAAVWVLYSPRLGLLALDAPYLGYTLEPNGEPRETSSPEEALPKLLEQLEGEEGLRLLSLDFVLTDESEYWRDLRYTTKYGGKKRSLGPMWRLRAETGEGEKRTSVINVSGVSKRTAYDLMERCYLETVQSRLPDIFREYCGQNPDADVWLSSWGVRRGEDGQEYVEVLCYGVDIPALEASGYLPGGVALDYTMPPFNQKEAHPCPHEPEWEKKYWSEEREDAVTLTLVQLVYPLYPEYVEVTVRCKKSFQWNLGSYKKYVDGEWQPVWRTIATTMDIKYVEAGENTLKCRTGSKLGPGLYRLYLNQEYWVEFQVSDEVPLPAS